MEHEFSGAELADLVAKGKLKEKAMENEPIRIRGMVKQSEGNDGTVLFCLGSGCEHWVRIPISVIEKGQYLKSAASKLSQNLGVLRLRDWPSFSGFGPFAATACVCRS